jgi:hypothetical protein
MQRHWLVKQTSGDNLISAGSLHNLTVKSYYHQFTTDLYNEPMTTTLFTASLQHVMMNLIVTLQFQH